MDLYTTKTSKISLSQYLSVAIWLAENGGKIIREVHESGQLQEKYKDSFKTDPVTIADLTVQKTIEECFQHFFPTLQVQGEESEKSMKGIQTSFDPQKINTNFINNEFLLQKIKDRFEFNQFMRLNAYDNEILDDFQYIDTQNAVVWVDPLDGTNDFVSGNLSAVTVLIGLAIDGVPKVGVVHHPYKTNEPSSESFTIFATQEHGAFYLDCDSDYDQQKMLARIPKYLQPFDQQQAYDSQYQLSVGCSLSHMSQQMEETINSLQPVIMHRLGGAGNKVNRIALNEVDSYVQPRAGLQFWDLCGPESIIRAMGGICQVIPSNPLSEQWNQPQRISYDVNKNNGNSTVKGFAISQTLNMQKQLMSRLKLIAKI